ncbi:TPA: nucleoside deaminase, partial [Aeromonas hydrophila]|nr:nucleoside deaminase [Aeromonas hydrophila]
MPHSLAEPAGSRLIASLTANPSHQEWLEQALQL